MGDENSIASVEDNFVVSFKMLNALIAILILGIYPKVSKTGIQTNTCEQLFTAAQLIIAKKLGKIEMPING